MQQRYDADMRRLAMLIAMLLLQYSRGGALPTDARSRLSLKAAIWAQVLKPYFVGGDEPFRNDVPQSQYARLLRDGIEGAVRIQVKRQQSILRRYVKDAALLSWLLSPNYSQPPTMPKVSRPEYKQPFYSYVDGSGYTLGDRITRNAVDVRAKVFRMIDWHSANGDAVQATGAALTNFMTIAGRATRKPYGDYGAYAPWRGLRGEMLMQTGRAAVLVGLLNPAADGVQWRLSPVHKDTDQCDINASGGANGDGIYPANSAPPFPNHPGCLCSLVSVPIENTAQIGAIIAGMMAQNRGRGMMNEDALTRALLSEQERQMA
jgi:hypothetical protein